MSMWRRRTEEINRLVGSWNWMKMPQSRQQQEKQTCSSVVVLLLFSVASLSLSSDTVQSLPIWFLSLGLDWTLINTTRLFNNRSLTLAVFLFFRCSLVSLGRKNSWMTWVQKLHSQPGLSKMCDDLPFFTKTQYLFSDTRTLRLVPHPAAASFCQDVWPYFTFSCLHFDLVLLGRIAHFKGGGGEQLRPSHVIRSLRQKNLFRLLFSLVGAPLNTLTQLASLWACTQIFDW